MAQESEGEQRQAVERQPDEHPDGHRTNARWSVLAGAMIGAAGGERQMGQDRLLRAPAGRLDVRFAGLLAACAVVALVFWSTPLLVPFRLFVTVVHELGHAVATVLTGGQVTGIEISPGGGGLTLVRGGNFFVSVSAGYLGSSLFGAALLLMARAPWRRRLLQVLAVGLVVAVLGFFREPFGVLVALLTAAAFWALAARGPEVVVTLFVALL